MHFILIRHFPFGISLFSAFVQPAILAGHAGTDAATLRGGTPLADSSGGQSQRSARLQLSAGRYITGPLGAVETHTLRYGLGDRRVQYAGRSTREALVDR